jgi:hypothetical protein
MQNALELILQTSATNLSLHLSARPVHSRASKPWLSALLQAENVNPQCNQVLLYLKLSATVRHPGALKMPQESRAIMIGFLQS